MQYTLLELCNRVSAFVPKTAGRCAVKSKMEPPAWVVLFAWAVLLLPHYGQAKTVTYDFNVTWVMANPDGLMERKVVGINGQWPLPTIEVDKGDRLVVNMHNGLGDKNASIHFHGMFQNGTNEMDGPSMVTQCPVPPGFDFTYNFTVNQNGTYWYHCHTDYCYPDGYRQALIVHDNDAFFHDDYDEEFVITVSDWYHEMVEDIAPTFLSLYNPTGAEPIPNAFLFNDTFNTSIPVKPNTTYLLRLVNIGAFVAQYFYIEDHTFRIVEIDGVYTEPTEADTLYISVAQRYSILVTTKGSTDQNYAIVTVADSRLLDTIPPDLRLNNTNWLEYNREAAHPQAVITVNQASDLVPFDDITLVPYDHTPLLPEPDHEITVTVFMNNLLNGFDYAFLDNISYTAPKVPTLYSVLSSGDLATNAQVYGEFTHSVVLNHNDVVQIVLNNGDTGTHPFHLHGHNFQVIDRAPSYGPNFYNYLNGNPVAFDPQNHTAFPAFPARRDVFVLPPQGYWVIRFVADNPGVWFFHCHIDWHLSQGLGMLLIEAPTQLQQRSSIPDQHYEVCRANGIAYQGNAAANTKDLLDLSGQNEQPPFLPAGFTSRGIVALAFSAFSAFLGMAFIVVYGMSDVKFVAKDAVVGSTGISTQGNLHQVVEEYQD
jgi:iron transport multicopper oxidase